jgi:hypothetical protein
MEYPKSKMVANVGSILLHKPLGIDFYNYQLGKKPGTWAKKINDIDAKINSGEIHGLVIYLATPLFLQASKAEFIGFWEKLLGLAKNVKSIVIVYEENMHENFDYYDYHDKKYYGLEEITRRIAHLEKELEDWFTLEHDSEMFAQYQETLRKYSDAFFENTMLYGSDTKEFLDSMKEFRAFRVYQNEQSIRDSLFKLEKGKERLEDYQSRTNEISNFIDNIVNSDLELCTFSEKESVQYRLQPFFEELLKDIFFTVYISQDQLLSAEFVDFIKIFEKYVQQIEGYNFTIDNSGSINGNTYLFKSADGKINSKNFQQVIHRFNEFMELCSLNPESALQILNSKFTNPQKALDTLQIFSRKYKRLMMDIEHQKERLNLMIKQDLESALVEMNVHENTTSLIANLEGDLFNLLNTKRSLNENYLIQTNSHYTTEEKQIIDLAREFGSAEDISTVRSNIDKLKDNYIVMAEKKTAGERIKHLLFKVV